MRVKQLFCSIVFLVCVSHSVFAQYRNTDYYVEKMDGTQIAGSHVEPAKSLFGKLRIIRVDNEEIDIDKVKRYRDITGEYVRIQPINKSKSFFAKLVIDGPKISVFTKEVNYSKSQYDPSSGVWMPGPTITELLAYYKIDEGPVKPSKLKYMKSDLSDNPASMTIIKQIKTLNWISAFCYVGGVTLVTSMIINNVSNIDPAQDKSIISPGFVVGVILLNIPAWAIRPALKNKKKEAIYLYNH